MQTARVNQRDKALGGKWNYLGEYTFGSKSKVVLKVEKANSYNADAIDWVKVDSVE